MDAKTFIELFTQLGLAWTILIGIAVFLGNLLSRYVSKRWDVNLERTSKASDEMRQTKLRRYEELVEYLEKLLSRGSEADDKAFIRDLNVIYAKMVFFVPGEIVRLMTKEFDGYFDAKNRTRLYLAIRKDVFGKTDLTEGDLRYWSLRQDRPPK